MEPSLQWLSREHRHFSGPEDPGGPQARALSGSSIWPVSGVQGRGVLVDLFARHGAKRAFVGYDELMRIMDEDKVVVDTGDMFRAHTGWLPSGDGSQGQSRRRASA